jgi:hypothetical protein
LKLFEPKRDEDGSWRKLHNDELHNLYSSTNIVRVIKSRRMRWAGRYSEKPESYHVIILKGFHLTDTRFGELRANLHSASVDAATGLLCVSSCDSFLSRCSVQRCHHLHFSVKIVSFIIDMGLQNTDCIYILYKRECISSVHQEQICYFTRT